VTPLFGVIGVLSALHMAQRTGIGQHVDVSMLGTLSALVAGEGFDVLESLGIPLRTGQTVPRLAPFGVYATQDGHIALCAPTDAFVLSLFRAMEQPNLALDDRFCSRDARVSNSRALDQQVAQWAVGYTTSALIERLSEHGVPAAEVRDPHAAVRDPRVVARGECVPIAHPLHPEVTVQGMGIPITFSAATAVLDRPPPRPGEHNEYVYGQLLGYSPGQLAALRTQGVI